MTIVEKINETEGFSSVPVIVGVIGFLAVVLFAVIILYFDKKARSEVKNDFIKASAVTFAAAVFIGFMSGLTSGIIVEMSQQDKAADLAEQYIEEKYDFNNVSLNGIKLEKYDCYYNSNCSTVQVTLNNDNSTVYNYMVSPTKDGELELFRIAGEEDNPSPKEFLK